MTAEDLKNYRAIIIERDHLKDLLTEVETALYYPKVQVLSKAPSGGTPADKYRVETLIDKRASLLSLYTQKYLEAVDAIIDIENAISALPYEDREIIRYRYVEGCSWTDIAEATHYSLRGILNRHKKILKKLN